MTSAVGRSARPAGETNCDCNRSDEPNLLQSIYLQNDNDITAAIDRADGWLVERTGAKPGVNPGAAEFLKNPTAGLEGVPLPQLEARLAEARANQQPARILRLEMKIAELKKDDEALARLKVTLARMVANANNANNGGEMEANAKGAKKPGPKAIAKAEALIKAGAATGSMTAATTAKDRQAIVREAYLRTLGRSPEPAEAEAAEGHLAEASDSAKGLRDLLWALLNTKEFITNH